MTDVGMVVVTLGSLVAAAAAAGAPRAAQRRPRADRPAGTGRRGRRNARRRTDRHRLSPTADSSGLAMSVRVLVVDDQELAARGTRHAARTDLRCRGRRERGGRARGTRAHSKPVPRHRPHGPAHTPHGRHRSLPAGRRGPSERGRRRADHLSRRPVTVRGTARRRPHINNIFTKIGVVDRGQAVVYAYRTGLAPRAD